MKTSKKDLKRSKKWAKDNRSRYNEISRQSYKKKQTENPIIYIIRQRKRTSIKNNIKFTLTKEWAKSTYTGCCSITGIRFNSTTTVNPYSPSIDRIDNNKGYTPDNCRIVLFGINALKSTGTDKNILEIANAIIKNATKLKETK